MGEKVFIFKTEEIKNILISRIRELYPYYNDIDAFVAVYNKNEYRDIEYDKVRLAVNNDFLGYIENRETYLYAKGIRLGVGYIKENAKSLEEAVEFLIKGYFRLK